MTTCHVGRSAKNSLSKMSNGFAQDAIYKFVILYEFIKFLIVLFGIYCLVELVLLRVFDVIMIETSKKRKRNSNAQPNQTVNYRGPIDANWQKFLSSSLIMDNKSEKPAQDANKDHYTGTFRRSRKKKAKNQDTVQSGMKTLNLEADGLKNEHLAKSVSNDSTIISSDGKSKNRLTKFLSMDCEMVGVGYDGNDHMLARVSIVNKFGDCVYDKFVKAREEVKDYRTDISGVRKEDLLNGEDFTTVQKEVSELIRGRIIVGHSLKNDLTVLFLSHPKRSIRDTSRYKPFRKITKGSTPSLKRLAKEILGIDIQHGEHSSVEDARAAMQLYCTVAKQWEASLSQKRHHMKIIDD